MVGLSSSRTFWYSPVGSPSVNVSIVCGTSNRYSASRMSSSISTMYASISSPFIFTPAHSIDCAFSLARLSAKRLVKEAATSFHSCSSAVLIPPCICRASHRFTAITHSLTLVPFTYVRKNIACRYGLTMRALSLLTAQYNSHPLMKRVVLLLSPSYIVGASPASFPCCICGIGNGGGPQLPPGGAPGSTTPPPGYPPPPGCPP